MPLRLIADANAQTTIPLALTAGATSFVGATTANFTSPQNIGNGVARLTILDAGNGAYNPAAPFATPFEYVDYTSNVVGTNTISGLTRGVAGTTAHGFFAGAIVAQGLLVEDILASSPWKFDEQTPTGIGVVTIPASGTIPGSYLGINWRNLRIELEGRSTTAADHADVTMTFNGDGTAANYSWVDWIANNNAVASVAHPGALPTIARIPAANDSAGLSGTAGIVIPNFARTTFAKTARSNSLSFEAGSAAGLWNLIRFANWAQLVAITTVTLTLTGGNWLAGSIIHTYLEP